MKAQRNSNYGHIVTEGADRYNETISAQATSRVLDGSSDHGYWMEYVGYGEVDGIPVQAVYLIGHEEENEEEAENYDWDSALYKNGRIVVMVDDLTDNEYEKMKNGEEIKR